jgi:hypothetical protein
MGGGFYYAKSGKGSLCFYQQQYPPGFSHFIPQLLCGLHRLYVLEGPLGSGQGVFIRQLGEDVLERGLCAEFWISASDPLNPEGILIPEMETAVVCSQLIESVAYKEIPLVRFLDIASFMDQSMLTRKTGVIEDLYEQIARCSQTASHICLTQVDIPMPSKNIPLPISTR